KLGASEWMPALNCLPLISSVRWLRVVSGHSEHNRHLKRDSHRATRRHSTNLNSGKESLSPQSTLWYKDAVIYQVHVRAFYDSTGDGIGDFLGLAQKL